MNAKKKMKVTLTVFWRRRSFFSSGEYEKNRPKVFSNDLHWTHVIIFERDEWILSLIDFDVVFVSRSTKNVYRDRERKRGRLVSPVVLVHDDDTLIHDDKPVSLSPVTHQWWRCPRRRVVFPNLQSLLCRFSFHSLRNSMSSREETSSSTDFLWLNKSFTWQEFELSQETVNDTLKKIISFQDCQNTRRWQQIEERRSQVFNRPQSKWMDWKRKPAEADVER